MVEFCDEVIDVGGEGGVAGAGENANCVIVWRFGVSDCPMFWHNHGPVAGELLGGEDTMEELENSFSI